MLNNSKLYSIEELDNHFGDSILPSSSKPAISKSTLGTFNIWTVHSNPAVIIHLIDMDANDAATEDPIPVEEHILSRLTVFARSAQPFSTIIYTRSEPTVLTKNIGRIIPVFRATGHAKRGAYSWDGYVKVVAIEIIPGRSDELKRFISKKVQMEGLQKERTKEQCEETFGSDWCKAALASVVPTIGDPREITDVRGVIAPQMKGLLDDNGIGPIPGNIINQDKGSFDQHLLFAIRQFDVGFFQPAEPEMPGVHNAIINVGSMIGSTIQQGSPAATQTTQITLKVDLARTALAELESALSNTNLSHTVRDEMLADVRTIGAQLSKPTPSTSIVHEAGRSLRNVVEGVAAGALTQPFITAPTALWSALGLG